MRRRAGLLATWALVTVVGALVGVAIPLVGGLFGSQLAAVAAGCIVVQALLVTPARQITGRWLGVLPIVVALWTVYYPVRLVRLQLDRDGLLAHPAVRQATDGDLVWVWLVSTVGLAALVLGAWTIRGVVVARPARLDRVRRRDFKVIAGGALAVYLASIVFELSSGILANLSALVLLGVAGMGFQDARAGRTSLRTIVLVLLAALLGALAGFKELATLPVVSWGIGLMAGRREAVRVRAVLMVAAVATVAFVGVAGQRIAAPLDEPASLPRATLNGFTRYDLESATLLPEPKRGAALATNVAAGVSKRASGIEALIILHEAVPARVSFEGGRTLVLPTLTVLPGGSSLAADPAYPILSLGRYYAQTFYSLRPDSDPSSQAITWAGDLYLNFGTAGIVLGLLVIGGLIGLLDRKFPPTTSFNAGLLAYVGTAAIGLERNVAYVFVTVAMRLAIASAVYWFLTARRHPPEPAASSEVTVSGPATRSTLATVGEAPAASAASRR